MTSLSGRDYNYICESVHLAEGRQRCRTLVCSPKGRSSQEELEHRWTPSVQRRKVWLTPTTWLPCSKAAKTRKPLKLAGVPQTGKPIAAASWRKFTILRRHLEDILLLNSFFSIFDTCLICEDIARQSCAIVLRWRFLATFCIPCFSPNRLQHVWDLHLKFALRPHHVCKYGRHPFCDGWD